LFLLHLISITTNGKSFYTKLRNQTTLVYKGTTLTF
ncbi:hypothetical protein LINPERPRIM_LOCUS39930, partial [Linum perenne]